MAKSLGDTNMFSNFSVSRRQALGLATAALASATFGTGAAFAQGKPKRGGILKVSATTNPSSLDPATGGAGSDHTFLWTMYDTLAEWDYATLQPKPGLAKWAYPDPHTMVLDLQPNVTFHDGTPLDAEAVKFNLERNKTDAKSNLKPDLANVASIEVTGPLQVTLKLSQPDSALPGIFSDRTGMMVSPTAVKANGGILNRTPVGSGAYSFVSWTDNNRITLKRNDKYWKPEKPYPDGLEFAIIQELTTGLRSVTAGQNDFIYQLPPRQKMIVDRAKNLKTASGPTLYCIQLYLNWAKPPFDNVKVRQALNFAIDRDVFVKGALAGIGEPARMNLPSTHWGYDAEVAKLYPYNPEKARQLLAEAGFKDGLSIEMGGYNDQDSVQRQEILIEMFRKVGLNVRFLNGSVAEASTAFFGAEKKGAALLSAWTGRPDPSMSYSLMYTKDAYYNGGRGDVPPELLVALKESRATEDLAARKKALSTIQRIVMENAFVAPLAFQFELAAMSTKVQGYSPNLLGKPKYENIWLEG